MKSADDFHRQVRADDFANRFGGFLYSGVDLPTLPSLLWEIRAALHDRRNGSAEVAMVVEQDPSLAASVLRSANSSYFGTSGNFLSIKDAVTHIGRRELERIVNTTLIIDMFSGLCGKLDYSAFWTHSLQVAEAAMFITDQNPVTSPFIPSEAYIAGLLHDLGKLILDQYFTEDYATVRSLVENCQCNDAEAEQDTLGMDHGEIAARVMEFWNLRPNLIESVRCHHRVKDSESEYREFAETIGRANTLCHSCEFEPIPEDLFAHPSLGLDADTAESLAHMLDDVKQRARLLLI